MCRWKFPSGATKPCALSGFQSLFFWMCRWKSTSITYSIESFNGFNPYSFGCVAESIKASGNIQPQGSFNPYSFGCVAESDDAEELTEYDNQVSILILLDVSLKVTVKWITIKTCFHVSILILLDVSLKDLSNLSLIKTFKSFNPYSFGCVAERLH